MEAQLKTLVNVLETLARQDERLKHMDKQIEDLKRGRGFVFEPVVGAIPPKVNYILPNLER